VAPVRLALNILGVLLGLAILVAGSTGYVAKVLWELRGAAQPDRMSMKAFQASHGGCWPMELSPEGSKWECADGHGFSAQWDFSGVVRK
jgi:hypothetical protein